MRLGMRTRMRMNSMRVVNWINAVMVMIYR